MRRIVTRVLIAVLVIAACSTALPDSLSGFLARTFPPGAGGTVIAARGDRMLYCEGFGMADREGRIAATCDTVYDVMSITKQFTAAAILKLETLGKLRVADPISTHLGPVPADKRGITVHHLLTHTAGLVEALGGDYDVLTREAMIGGAMSSDLISPPGAQFHYSNYEQFLATHLFGPAAMTSTGYKLPQWDRKQIAVEYGADDNSQGHPHDHPWAADGPHWNLRGNGGILSTARDMFRWHRALTGDKFLPRSSRELRDATMAFWVSNHAYQQGRWNLEDLASELTLGILNRTRTQPS